MTVNGPRKSYLKSIKIIGKKWVRNRYFLQNKMNIQNIMIEKKSSFLFAVALTQIENLTMNAINLRFNANNSIKIMFFLKYIRKIKHNYRI